MHCCHQISWLNPTALFLHPNFAIYLLRNLGKLTICLCVSVAPSVKWNINALINVDHLIQSLTTSNRYKYFIVIFAINIISLIEPTQHRIAWRKKRLTRESKHKMLFIGKSHEMETLLLVQFSWKNMPIHIKLCDTLASIILLLVFYAKNIFNLEIFTTVIIK